ncbi:MAG: glycerophosphodiester phosphodiesterase family protein [Oscillatoria sp. PMC 1051.18]|nr:glycerophosphodiester phosphodiesterase family protein [Oscillatoria sp. PMC 1050.18]MEC5032695.1 glycerophosphodiester phosphodiesterase family protein [Oscillatoria sp. PMC 1051.18]
MKKLVLIAHRGFSAIAPENTLAALSAAIAAPTLWYPGGVGAVEFDLQLSADGIPVIIHDSTLDRTTNGRGLVREKSLAQLKQLSAGSWFSSQFAEEKIPTFQEALDLLKPTNLQVYAEVKQGDLWNTTSLDNFVTKILSQGWYKRCIVTSFNDSFLQQVAIRSPDITLGFYPTTLDDYSQKLRQATSRGNAVLLCEYHLLLAYPILIETTYQEDVDLVAWTVDNPTDLHQLVALGVNQIVTNSLLDRQLFF